MREKPDGKKKRSRPRGARHGLRTDWARVDATTETELASQIRQDEDVEFTDEMVAAARWVLPPKKVPISFRVDPDVLEFFKAEGAGYQSRMNAVLRSYMRSRMREEAG